MKIHPRPYSPSKVELNVWIQQFLLIKWLFFSVQICNKFHVSHIHQTTANHTKHHFKELYPSNSKNLLNWKRIWLYLIMQWCTNHPSFSSNHILYDICTFNVEPRCKNLRYIIIDIRVDGAWSVIDSNEYRKWIGDGFM